MVRPLAPRVWLTPLLFCAACFAAAFSPAKSAVFFGFGAPFYYPPPVYYPPPAYYAPPPVYYPPPVMYAPEPWSTPPRPYPYAGSYAGRATTCYAGRYVCPMQVPIAAGGTCWCPDNRGGRSYGRAS